MIGLAIQVGTVAKNVAVFGPFREVMSSRSISIVR